jgi:aromatic-L-amino-acid decarboxylase
MNPDEFRKHGYQVIDWIADYLSQPEKVDVLSQVSPGDVKAQLPSQPPQQGESIDAMLADFKKIIVPGMTHWNHPSFYAWFSITASEAGILADALASTLNPNGMLWRSSPAATELEELALDWLRQMLGLPEDFKGIITDSASMSTFLAIAAAREALNLDIRQKGMAGRDDLPRLRLYTSEQAHSSIEKGAMTLGIGQEGVRKIPVDDNFAMIPAELARAIEEDIAAGWRPFCVVASIGTTSTTSVDPIPQIVPICREHGLWLHVDAAYGGMVGIIPARRAVLAGVEDADSFVTNPHKWMGTPIDLSAFYLRDPDMLKRAFSLVPEYLKTADGEATNYMDWGVQLGRRFRGLKLWMVIREFGQEGLAEKIENAVQLGQTLAGWIDAHPDFERLAPTPFSTVCFRYRPYDLKDKPAETPEYLNELNTAIIEAVNATGQMFYSPTKLHGKVTMRIAIGNFRTEERHIAQAWELIQKTGEQMRWAHPARV